MPTVDLADVRRRFSGTVALDGVSLQAARGVTGLLGPNGAGKTTLLRVLATVLAPDAGEVRLLGLDPRRDDERVAIRRRLGYLPQEPGFHRHFTAFEFVDYVAILKELTDRRARHDEVRRVLAAVDLQDVANRRIRALSGGMRRRVGLAQALLGDPDLLVLDEPTAGLDPEQRLRFRELVSAVAEHRTVIVSTHQTEDVAALCARVVVLHGGGRAVRGHARASSPTWRAAGSGSATSGRPARPWPGAWATAATAWSASSRPAPSPSSPRWRTATCCSWVRAQPPRWRRECRHGGRAGADAGGVGARRRAVARRDRGAPPAAAPARAHRPGAQRAADPADARRGEQRVPVAHGRGRRAALAGRPARRQRRRAARPPRRCRGAVRQLPGAAPRHGPGRSWWPLASQRWRPASSSWWRRPCFGAWSGLDVNYAGQVEVPPAVNLVQGPLLVALFGAVGVALARVLPTLAVGPLVSVLVLVAGVTLVAWGSQHPLRWLFPPVSSAAYRAGTSAGHATQAIGRGARASVTFDDGTMAVARALPAGADGARSERRAARRRTDAPACRRGRSVRRGGGDARRVAGRVMGVGLAAARASCAPSLRSLPIAGRSRLQLRRPLRSRHSPRRPLR